MGNSFRKRKGIKQEIEEEKKKENKEKKDCVDKEEEKENKMAIFEHKITSIQRRHTNNHRRTKSIPKLDESVVEGYLSEDPPKTPRKLSSGSEGDEFKIT